MRKLLIWCAEKNGCALPFNETGNEYEIIKANSAEEAKDILNEFADCLSAVLLCLDASSADAFAFISGIRAGNVCSNIPVLALVGSDVQGAGVAALNAGADDVVAAPYNEQVIENRLRNLIACVHSNKIDSAEANDQLFLLSETATSLLMGKNADEGINNVLRQIMAYFRAERAYVFELDYEAQTASNTYEICADSVGAEKDNLQNVPFDVLRLWLDTFERKLNIYIEDMDLLDESRADERRILSEQGIKSLIAVPLRKGAELIGFVGVDNPHRQQHSIDGLSAIGDYIAAMLVHRELDKKIEYEKNALKAMMDDTPGGFCKFKILSRSSAQMVYANKGFCELTGMTHEEVMAIYGSDAVAGVHPEDRRIIASLMDNMLATGELRARYRLRRGDGGYVPVMVFGRMLRAEDGCCYLNSYYTDITEQAAVEEQRKELLDNLPCGAALYVYDGSKLSAVHVNKRYGELVARDTSRPAELDVSSAIHPDDRVKVIESIERSISKNENVSCDIRVLYGKNEYRRFRVSGGVVDCRNGEYAVYATYTPITDLEITLQETVPIVLAAIMESSSDLSFAKDKDFRYICASRAFAKMAGLEHEDKIIGKTDYEIFPKVLADKFRSDDAEMLENGQPLIDIVEPIMSDDGITHYSSTSKYILRDTAGSIIGIYGVGRDITEYRTAFEQLKLLADNISGGLATIELSNHKPKVIYYTEGFYKYLGVDEEEFEAEMALDLFHYVSPKDKDETFAALERLRTGASKNEEYSYRCVLKDGTERWIKNRATLSERHGSRAIISVVKTDVTLEKLADEAERVHREEMDIAIAQMGKMIFEYNPATRSMSVPEHFAQKFGTQRVIENVPQSIYDLGIYEGKYAKRLEEFADSIIAGRKTGSVDLRSRGATGAWRWEHCEFVTIFGDDGVPLKTIISYEDTTDLEETRLRYEHEMQLRHELIGNSVIFYELNLTQNIVEEYSSKFNDVPGITTQTPADEVLNSKILYNICEEHRASFRNAVFSRPLLDAYNRGESNVSVEYRRMVPGGGKRWFRVNSTIMKRPDTNDVVAFIYVSDIDREKKDRLALDGILDEEIDSVCILNAASGLAHMVKQNAEYVAGKNEEFDFEEQISSLIKLRIPPEEREECEEFFKVKSLKKRLDNEPSVMLSFRFVAKDGSIFRKRTLAFYLDETHEEIVLSHRDITGLYIEEQRQKQRLQELTDAANRASSAKSDFLSRISHDMRTPLNAVLSFSNTEMTDDASEEQLREYLGKINYSGEYLLGIINDVLDMSKIEQKKIILNPEPYLATDFEQTIKTVIGELSSGKNIDFVFEANYSEVYGIMADKVRFNQIFINLLSNAVKFTPPGGKVELIIEQGVIKDGFTHKRFIVRDNGVGMSPEFIPHAFESFSQEYRRNAPANNQGTGLGLAIVKEIVTLMNGTITVESELGKGTTFFVDLPLKTVTIKGEKKKKTENAQSLKGVRILLCEDNEMNTEIAVMLLQKQGCEVDCTENGKEGVEKFAQSDEGFYDAVLMDIRMPVMSGIEAAQEIRKLNRPDAATVPIIAMTADAFLEDEQISHDAGMNAHLTKPIEPSKLYESLKSFVKK